MQARTAETSIAELIRITTRIFDGFFNKIMQCFIFLKFRVKKIFFHQFLHVNNSRVYLKI
jgi:hypothetical protein